MTYPITKTDNYILITSDEEIKDDDYYICWDNCYDPARYSIYVKSTGENGENAKKIIAHLPLNNSSILEDVPLLPPFEEVKYDFAEMFYSLLKATYPDFDEWVEAKEYKKSKDNHISQPKLPIGFKVAIKNMKTDIDRHTITGWENVIIDGGVVQGRWIFE